MNWCYAVLSYNHYEHTRNCIQSILKIDPSARIYLIHNGTEKKQRLALETAFNTTPQLIPITLEDNRGYSGGLNYGLSTIFNHGEDFVFVLTNDTELTEIPKHAVTPSVIVPLILNKRTQKIDSFGGYFVPRQGHLYHRKQDDDIFTDTDRRLTYLPGSAFLIPKSAFHATKGFWEQLGTYWEDVELSQRLKQQGFPLLLNSEFKLTHKIGKTCHKDKFYTTYSYQRNRLVISWQFSQGFEKIILLLISTWQLFRWTLRSILKSNYESLRLYIRALSDAIKMIKENTGRP